MDNNGCPKHISWQFLATNSIVQIKDGWTYRKETQKSKHLDLNYAERSNIVQRNSLHGLAFGLLANRKFSNNTDGYFTSINLSPITPNLLFCSLFSFEYKTSSKTISKKKNSYKTSDQLNSTQVVAVAVVVIVMSNIVLWGNYTPLP